VPVRRTVWPVTVAGSPGEELIDSADAKPTPRPWRLLTVAAVIVAIAAGLFAFQALQPEPAPDQSTSTPSPTEESTTSPADPSLVDASARRLYGDLQPEGTQSFSTAVSAATDIVRIYCRPDIPSWAATLITSDDAYNQATFLMSPANRAYGTFVVQVELTWSTDHYAFAVIAGHVERCS